MVNGHPALYLSSCTRVERVTTLMQSAAPVMTEANSDKPNLYRQAIAWMGTCHLVFVAPQRRCKSATVRWALALPWLDGVAIQLEAPHVTSLVRLVYPGMRYSFSGQFQL